MREVNGSCLSDPSFSNVQEQLCIQSVCLQKQSCDGRDGSFWILPPRRLSPEGRGTEIAGTPPFMSPEAFVERDGVGVFFVAASLVPREHFGSQKHVHFWSSKQLFKLTSRKESDDNSMVCT